MQNFLDGVDELLAGGVLHQKPGRARPHRPGRNLGFALHRQDDELAVDASLLEPGQRLEAVHRRHVDVGDDNVRAQADSSLDQQVPVGDRGHHVELVLQQADQTLGQDCVIVGDQDGWTTHGVHEGSQTPAACATGWRSIASRTDSVVP